jgi:hypothetical protein
MSKTDDVTKKRKNHVVAMELVGNAEETLEKAETLADVSMIARVLLPILRWVHRWAVRAEEKCRKIARATYQS